MEIKERVASGQTSLRDKIAEIALLDVENGRGRFTDNVIDAFVACIGAAAIMAAVLPHDSREAVLDGIEDILRRHADQRAREMASGKFDEQFRWSQ